MLQDFYMLEMYFGDAESAQSYETLVEKYGSKAVLQNLADGFLEKASLSCWMGRTDLPIWLSEKGRKLASQKLALSHSQT